MVPPAALGELAMDPRDPLPYRSAHALLDEAPIDDIARIAVPGSPLALVQLRHMGGALARHTPGAGARATLPGRICMLTISVGPDTTALDELAATAQPVGVYPNFVEHEADVSAFFDPGTWARLRQAKALYDPRNVFKSNHPVAP
jgi:hypothetical protein